MSLTTHPLSLTVNGERVGPLEVPADMVMLDFLNEHLNLSGPRLGCGQGICHACTVIVQAPDGHLEEERTCIAGAHSFAGKSVLTIEGHATRDASGNLKLTPVQRAFMEHFAFQCGYCTPGFVTAATVLLDRLKRTPPARKDLEAVITEALDQHLCRCTGYVRYYEAVRQVILDTPGLVQG
jgi:aerobic-type carbon monoxide dehydrogenase small subunit (CoxS/CutS family)